MRRMSRRSVIAVTTFAVLAVTATTAAGFVASFPEAAPPTTSVPETSRPVVVEASPFDPAAAAVAELPEITVFNPDAAVDVTQPTPDGVEEVPGPPTQQTYNEVPTPIVAAPAVQQTPERVLVVGSNIVVAANTEIVDLFETAGVSVIVDTTPNRAAVTAAAPVAAVDSVFANQTPTTPPADGTLPPSETTTSPTVVSDAASQLPPTTVPRPRTALIVALGQSDPDSVVFEQSVDRVLEVAQPEDTVIWVLLNGPSSDAQRSVLRAAQERFDNLLVADWAEFAADRSEWLSGSSLNLAGRAAFSRYVAAAVFDRGVAG